MNAIFRVIAYSKEVKNEYENVKGISSDSVVSGCA
ncbi:MAG: hypothetical protein NEHIOOID_00389 [Holosporales bacterium]